MGCKTRGHSSKDLLCPTYQHKVDETNAKHPENLMPFYPTHEIWTHALLPPQTQPRYVPRSNPSTTTRDPAPLHQTTINTHPTSGPPNHYRDVARPQGNQHRPYRQHRQPSSMPATSSNAMPIPLKPRTQVPVAPPHRNPKDPPPARKPPPHPTLTPDYESYDQTRLNNPQDLATKPQYVSLHPTLPPKPP
jgi:hypothetical protein